MIQYKSKRVRIRVDGRELPREEYLIGAVANGRIFGKGMKIAPQARLDDGLFDFVCVKGMKFLEFCANGWKLMNGTHLGHPKISLIRGRRIEAEPESGDTVLLELDGSSWGRFRRLRDGAPEPAGQGLSLGFSADSEGPRIRPAAARFVDPSFPLPPDTR